MSVCWALFETPDPKSCQRKEDFLVSKPTNTLQKSDYFCENSCQTDIEKLFPSRLVPKIKQLFKVMKTCQIVCKFLSSKAKPGHKQLIFETLFSAKTVYWPVSEQKSH